MRCWIAVAAGIAALSCGAAASRSLALVYEPFEARSQLLSSRALATNFSISLIEFQELAEAAKAKFGEAAQTSLQGDTGKVEITLNGKVVETTTIDYVGCVLVHDPDHGTHGASETVANHLYEVSPDRSLALIN